jgi:FtsZ-binding cell division protein ZapB
VTPALQAVETNVAYHYERPDQKALTDLEQVVHHLTEELAGWRRRTLKAEGELQEARAHGGVVAGPELKEARQRVVDLETENQALRQRIDAAKDRVQALAGRLSFLEQHGGGNAA